MIFLFNRYVLSFLIPVILGYLYQWHQSRKYPKKYRGPPSGSQRPAGKSPVNRDRYQSQKVPTEVDVIVIGSGIGGLTCGGLLSRCGYRVLVLEQHYLAGGATHTFEDHGFEWETGIHYIGNIEKRARVLDLITEHQINWTQLGWERSDGRLVYDEIVIGEGDAGLADGGMGQFRHEYVGGEEAWLADLVTKFPTEKENLKKYLQLVKLVAQKDQFFLAKIIIGPSWCRRWLIRLLNWWSKDYSQCTVQEVLIEYFRDPRLRAILAGQFGDYGPPPSRASFFMHASVVNHYLAGGYFPTGGPAKLAKEIIPVIEQAGGRVLVNQAVKKILLTDEDMVFRSGYCEEIIPPTVYGVEMDNGDVIRAPMVVSDAGVATTYGQLIQNNQVLADLGWSEIKDKIGPSTSFMFLFVGLKGNPTELKLKSCNSWVYPHPDYDRLVTEFLEDPLEAPMPLFIASGSAKDQAWITDHGPDKSTVILLTLAKKEWFQNWESETCMKRSVDYQDLKNQIGHRMLKEGLYRFYPHLKEEGRVIYWQMGSPLSIQHYLGAPNGEAYGLDCCLDRFQVEFGELLKPETTVPGLYLTGQDICTLGFTGAMMGGVLTAHSILGYGHWLDLLTGRNLISDLEKIKE